MEEDRSDIDTAGEFESAEDYSAWQSYFWPNQGTEEGFFSPTAIRTRNPRRVPRSHRMAKHPQRNPRQWSYTATSVFDRETVRLLVSWAVRWMRGNGLPLGYRDPCATPTTLPFEAFANLSHDELTGR